MHIFLTGGVNIGKSTIINKVICNILHDLTIRIAGLKTYIGKNNNIYMSSWNNKRPCKNYIIGIKKNNHAIGFTETFDSLGVKILENGQHAQLIIIDELGFLENKAISFQNKCLDLINKNTPILGVIKEKKIDWLEKIKTHPNVELITVTKDNRNELVSLVTNKVINLLK